MKIKDRLALNFTLISTGMLLFVLCSVYFIFLKFLEADFYARLTDRTMVTAKLYLEADEISRDALNKVRSQYLVKLSDEVIRIYDSKNKATFIGDRAQYWTAEVIDKVRKERKIQFKDGEHQVVGIFYKDNQGDFVILASATDQSSLYRLKKLFKIMLATFIIISILLLFSGRWLAKKILQPLHVFMEEVKKVGSANLEFRVKETTAKDEINQLAQNFNQLMEELEQAFILQKTFVSNASHELRTPITRVMMTAELALSKERQITDYQKVLESMLEDISKMDDIITGLLTLAKVDLELASSHLSPIRLDEILIDLKEEWQKQNGANLQLTFQIDHEPIILANTILLHIALNNIISNAFKFSNNQTIECILESNPQQIRLAIQDQGIGINATDLAEIFKPYYSRSAQSGQYGEGMGLYMASKIISLFKGHIEVESTPAKGSTFILSFPKL
ncbi:HAMP domain-containing sensor histidine kinase [Pedobacter sp. Hv1]|uniref:sensor histidine kinase n=1 Tax=Pedobacter sp. Hv1 TaxID=1740090 RepID=UPI0006D8A1F9|nr:ATP-binding protein [Pedobacter sp. Hv1]KQC00732.1 histidine kinase [Pedobacter sp. Hv1]